ncbi:MAG TPA: hypothetical protein DCZ91_26610 [Lachnospiraceae bacterium]|nr:hypothetical protein [Lachnospiraceae bacterium]
MNEKDPIFRSLAMIEERLQEKLTVEMLAEGIHFSKYHYQRIFRETVGETVMGYVNRRRLFLAAGELARGRDSVLAIALRYGYDSHEGFTRSFKAHLGVTPTEYRKYHSSIGFLGRKKEEKAMYSKSAEGMVRELNSLIVQAKETAEDTRKYKGADREAAAVYAQVWEFAARRADKMAGQLEEVLKRITSVTQNPDEISARFLIVKAVEDAAFEASVTAFQVGLMIARALPEYRSTFEPLCARYDSLAQNARVKSGKIAGFLNELWQLILQDMRKNAEQKIGDAVEAGLAAAGKLSDPALPYGYIAEGVREIAEAIAALSLEEVTAYGLEDALFRLDTVLFAADMDMLRAPQHRQLFDGISDFREKLGVAVEFFRNLSGEAAGAFRETAGTVRETAAAFRGAEKGSERKRTMGKMYSDLAEQEGILLFYLKGEIQKLGDAHLEEEQKAALNDICARMDRAVKMARGASDREEGNEIAELLSGAYEDMSVVAERLGVYGSAVRYLAEEVKKPLKYL